MKALVTAFVALLALSTVSSDASAQGRPFPGARPHDGGPMIHPARPDFQSEEAGRIYDALNVVQQDITGGRMGARTLEKSVGGLSCIEVREIGPMRRYPRYQCELSSALRLRHDARIYAALNVAARRTMPQMYDRFGNPVTDRWGRPVYDRNLVADSKEVGNLECIEMRSLRPRHSSRTTCTLR